MSDSVTRVDIPIGIAYGSSTRLARDLFLQLAAECKYVLDDPAPEALFKNFGECSLNFELQLCNPTREVWSDMIHELHTRIDDEFRRAGIEFAFPQRDIHIRSVPENLRGAQHGLGVGSAIPPTSCKVREMHSGGD